MGRKGDSGIVHCEPMIRCPNIVFSGIGSPRFKMHFIYIQKSVGAVFVLVENVVQLLQQVGVLLVLRRNVTTAGSPNWSFLSFCVKG